MVFIYSKATNFTTGTITREEPLKLPKCAWWRERESEERKLSRY